MTVALVAAVVSAVLSLSGSYLNTTQTQRHNTQQRLISERRLAYGKLLGAAIVLKQTEYFRWVSLFSRRFYEGLSLMEEPGGPSQRDYWQQAMAADDRQAGANHYASTGIGTLQGQRSRVCGQHVATGAEGECGCKVFQRIRVPVDIPRIHTADFGCR